MAKKKVEVKSNDQNPIKKIAEEEKVKIESVSSNTESSDDEEGEEISERKGVSYVFEDGGLVEMLYDSKKHKSKLAVYKDGVVSFEDGIQIDEETTFLPMAPNQSILKNNFILFASDVVDYKSNEDLYYEVRAFVDKYVKLSDEFLSVVSVFVMMSWLYDRFQSVPYLRVVGLWGTGKSRVLSVAGNICYKAVLAGGSTSTAALFRTLDLFNPTLVFDEAELSEKESVEMRQVLRQGYSSGLPVSRMDKGKDGGLYIKTFDVFGPKIIASQAGFRDAALESRCLTEKLYPLIKNERPIELSSQFKEEAQILRNKLLMFRFKNYWLTTADGGLLDGIELPRLKQTGLAIMSVAKMLGLQAVNDVMKFLIEHEKVLNSEQTDTVEHDVMLCILDLMCSGFIKEKKKIRIGDDLTSEFNRKHFEEYSDKKDSDSHSSYSVMKYSSYKVSARKIGGYVRKLGLMVERDREGFFVPVFKEYSKIQALAKRYGLDKFYRTPDDPMKVSEIMPPREKKKVEEKSDDSVKKEVKKSKEGDEDYF